MNKYKEDWIMAYYGELFNKIPFIYCDLKVNKGHNNYNEMAEQLICEYICDLKYKGKPYLKKGIYYEM